MNFASTRLNISDTAPWPVGKYLLFYALAGLVILACILGTPPAKVSKAGVEMRLPEAVLGFTGKDQPISEGERVLLPSDTQIVKKLYTDTQGEVVNFQIVLSDSPMKFSPLARWKRRHGNAAPWMSSISVQSAITVRLPAQTLSQITAAPRARIGIRTTM